MVAETPVDAGTETPTPEKPFKAWAFFRDNFSVLSGIAVVCGITLAITFLFAYLSAFSWQLIELIQYVDVISFGIVAVGVATGSIISITNLVESWFRFKNVKTKAEKWTHVIVWAFIGAGILGLYIYATIKAHQQYMHVIYGAVLLFMTVIVIISLVRSLSSAPKITAAFVFNYAIFAVLLSWFAGQWLAYTVQERPDFDQDIVTKNGEFKPAKIVMVMSRFTVLLLDKTLHVVPTGDIIEFKTLQPLNVIVSEPPQTGDAGNKVK